MKLGKILRGFFDTFLEEVSKNMRALVNGPFEDDFPTENGGSSIAMLVYPEGK